MPAAQSELPRAPCQGRRALGNGVLGLDTPCRHHPWDISERPKGHDTLQGSHNRRLSAVEQNLFFELILAFRSLDRDLILVFRSLDGELAPVPPPPMAVSACLTIWIFYGCAIVVSFRQVVRPCTGVVVRCEMCRIAFKSTMQQWRDKKKEQTKRDISERPKGHDTLT